MLARCVGVQGEHLRGGCTNEWMHVPAAGVRCQAKKCGSVGMAVRSGGSVPGDLLSRQVSFASIEIAWASLGLVPSPGWHRCYWSFLASAGVVARDGAGSPLGKWQVSVSCVQL